MELNKNSIKKILELDKEGKSIDEIILFLDKEGKRCRICDKIKLDVEERADGRLACDSCW